MPVKITLNVRKGSLAGKSFTYDTKESLIVGRQDDCGIVLPEATVSRYHCLVDITPPAVMVRDFSSLNGTYLNGEKIGQRAPGASAAEAKENIGAEFPLKPGDRLGLGKDCELELEVALPQYCADCFGEIDSPEYKNREDMAICADCHTRQKQEQESASRVDTPKTPKATKPKPPAPESNHDCGICGRTLSGGGGEPGLCLTCREDPLKVLKFLMGQALKSQDDAVEIAGYRNVKMLGKGGMGQVWLVEKEQTGERMALKVMLPHAKVDEKSKAGFLREAYVAGQLEHDNVVRHFSCGRSGEVYFILMELCDGGSVDKLVEQNGGKLKIDQALDITRQILDGFIYAHKASIFVKLKNNEEVTAKGIVHRDFKPGNIFLSGSGKKQIAKVADFGLAKAFETAGLSGQTMPGQLAGTLGFMPRQQILNYLHAKPEVDVWATAASLYFMLTGACPKEFPPGVDPIAAVLTGKAVPIRKRNASIPPRLAEVIDLALRDNPDIGVKNAAELKKMLDGAI